MTPSLIAHRTCPLHAAENSLAGVQAAVDFGADLVEVDVRRTRDGVPVLMHDHSPGRTATGRGSSALLRRLPLRVLPASLVTNLRLSGTLAGAGDPVPTLTAALASAAPGLGFALDVKDAGAGPAVLGSVCEAGLRGRVLIWSQSEAVVSHCAAAAPEIEVALLRDTFDASATRRLLDEAVAWGARGVSVHQDVLDAALVDDAHGRGLAVYCWFQSLAVQDEKLPAAARFGLDGVVTNWVSEARATLTMRA